MSERVDAVLLDIDDTLLDTTSAMIHAGAVAMQAVWPQQPPGWHAWASRRFRADPRGSFQRFTRGELSFAAMRRERLAEIAAAAGLATAPDAHTVYEEAFRPAFNGAQRVYEDVPGFLQRCRDGGLAVGAVTNASASVTEDKLRITGLGEQLSVVVTRDTLGFGKPDPRVFALACAQLGAEPAVTLFVGDELQHDAVGALAAGLRSTWLRRSGGALAAHRPDAGVPDVEAPEGIRILSSLNEIHFPNGAWGIREGRRSDRL